MGGYQQASAGNHLTYSPNTTGKTWRDQVGKEPVLKGVLAVFLLGDLPPFLSGLLDNLQLYNGWCESHLSASYPLKHSQRISQNLEKHKALLQKQLAMADDQVDLYRVSLDLELSVLQ